MLRRHEMQAQGFKQGLDQSSVRCRARQSLGRVAVVFAKGLDNLLGCLRLHVEERCFRRACALVSEASPHAAVVVGALGVWSTLARAWRRVGQAWFHVEFVVLPTGRAAPEPGRAALPLPTRVTFAPRGGCVQQVTLVSAPRISCATRCFAWVLLRGPVRHCPRCGQGPCATMPARPASPLRPPPPTPGPLALTDCAPCA